MPLNIATDRGHAVINPESLAAGSVIKIYGTVPMPFRNALTNMGLNVTAVPHDGLLNNGYQVVISAVVYNDHKVAFTELTRVQNRGWALLPMSNITPAPPLYV